MKEGGEEALRQEESSLGWGSGQRETEAATLPAGSNNREAGNRQEGILLAGDEGWKGGEIKQRTGGKATR